MPIKISPAAGPPAPGDDLGPVQIEAVEALSPETRVAALLACQYFFLTGRRLSVQQAIFLAKACDADDRALRCLLGYRPGNGGMTWRDALGEGMRPRADDDPPAKGKRARRTREETAARVLLASLVVEAARCGPS